MIQGNELNAGEDWTKFVTLNPPQEVKFKLIDQERLRATDTNNDVKAQANIEIINKSKSAILFKVKTTNIKNYMVRPNAEIIPSQHSITVKILTQHPISQKTRSL